MMAQDSLSSRKQPINRNEPSYPGTQTASSQSQPKKTFPSGVRLLHDSDHSIVDIIFIHSLTGDRERTWKAESASTPWPQTLLPSKVPKARIFTFGYDAYVTDWRDIVSKNRIKNHAMNLLTAIATYREDDGTNDSPIIFVCHGLGGLVCENALYMAQQRPDKHLKQVVLRTHGILFLGTPHHGSGIALWAKHIANAIGILQHTNSEILDLLKKDSEILAQAQEEFLSMIESRIQQGLPPIEIACFYEELPLPGVGIVVTSENAILPGYIPTGIQNNHMDMTKFEDAEDLGFVSVASEISRWAKQLVIPEMASAFRPAVGNLLLDAASQSTSQETSGQQIGQYVSNEDNIVRTRLPYAADAPFNSYNKHHEPVCLPNTRIGLLRDIYKWADGNPGQCIFWLHDWAGTGKSTISRTVARTFFNQHRLGASFFFSRGGGDVGNAGKFVTSLAVQLASSIPTLHQHVCDAIIEHTNISNQSLRDQWYRLIMNPLSKLDAGISQSSYVLVVDAIDECDDNNHLRTILQLLPEVRWLKTLRLKVFLTSRPETPSKFGVYQLPETERQEFIDPDIALFLKHHLNNMGTKDMQEPGWPGSNTIERLVKIANGSFIWAATACRFIGDGLLEDRLCVLLESGKKNAPEDHLNRIYTTVLRSSIHPSYSEQERERLCSMLRHVIGSIVTLFTPLSVESLGRLLQITREQVYWTLKNLHAIIDIPKETIRPICLEHPSFRDLLDHENKRKDINMLGNVTLDNEKDRIRPIRPHHHSFRDFFIDSDRCKDTDIQINEQQAHNTLAINCIQLMSKSLKQDICGLTAPAVLIAEIETKIHERNLPPEAQYDSLLEQYIPLEVQYACLHWISHLQKSETQLYDNGQVHQFLQDHLLHWLEALGWMKMLSEGIHAITILESMLLSNDCPRLSDFVYDIKRFILYHRSVMEQAPLQIYCSALIFTPKMSIVRKQFEGRMKQWLQQWFQTLPSVEKNWNALLQKLEGHSDWVDTVAFSPDGRQLASGSKDSTVRLWDTSSGAALQMLKGHLDQVKEVVFSPNGKQLASASRDSTVRLWDTSSGTALQRLESPSGPISVIAFSPDGKQLASGMGDSVRRWDTDSGAALKALEGHLGSVIVIAFSPDGKQLASGSSDSTIRLWDANSGAALLRLDHPGWIATIAFSPDGNQLASASNNMMIKLWDTSSGAALHMLKGDSEVIKGVAFSPDGKHLASSSNDATIRLWDVASGAALKTLNGHTGPVRAVAFSPDGKQLASVGLTVMLWDAISGAALQTLEGHSSCVSDIAFSPDGKQLASASRGDSKVRLWDISLRDDLPKLEGHLKCVNAVSFSPDGKQLASASNDSTIRLWDVGSGTTFQTLKSHSGHIKTVAFSPDGKRLASGSVPGTLSLWDASSGVVLHTIKVRWASTFAMAFSQDGKQLASASGDSTIRLWDASSGAALQTLKGFWVWAQAIVFSPDGKQLASTSDRSTLRLWDTGSGAALHTLECSLGFINTIAFSPNGKQLASGMSESTITLWDTVSGAVLQVLEGHSGTVSTLAFSPDGKQLASGSADSTVRLWDIGSGVALKVLKGHSSTVKAVAFLQNGKQLMSASEDRTVRLWDAGSGAALPHSLWLPKEHQPFKVAIHGSVICFGCESGLVSITEFSS